MPAKSGENSCSNGETQILRRRELWFREFGRVGAPQDQDTQHAVAEQLHREVGLQQEEVKSSVK
jgi:hypothetical protein